jgi:hypothetical protein
MPLKTHLKKKKMAINKMNTKYVAFSTKGPEEEDPERKSTKTVIFNCTLTQTAYGSVIVIKPSGVKIELYPSAIDSILFETVEVV